MAAMYGDVKGQEAGHVHEVTREGRTKYVGSQ